MKWLFFLILNWVVTLHVHLIHYVITDQFGLIFVQNLKKLSCVGQTLSLNLASTYSFIISLRQKLNGYEVKIGVKRTTSEAKPSRLLLNVLFFFVLEFLAFFFLKQPTHNSFLAIFLRIYSIIINICWLCKNHFKWKLSLK